MRRNVLLAADRGLTMNPQERRNPSPNAVKIPEVAPQRLLDELLRIAAGIGLETRSVGLRRKQSGAGGLCTINGRPVVILNEHASLMDRGTALADALAGRNLDAVEMPPNVRGFIVSRAASRSRLLLPERRPGPGLARCKLETARRRRHES